MVLVQSCIDNIGSWRKLLLSLTLVFPLGFGGKKHRQTAAMDRKGVGAWKIQSCCCPWQKAEGCGPNDFLVGRELPLLWLPPTVALRSFQRCPSSGKSLGACEGQRGKIRTRLLGGGAREERGGGSFKTTRIQWWRREKKLPHTSLLISKYSKGLWVCTIASQMCFKVYNWPDS